MPQTDYRVTFNRHAMPGEPDYTRRVAAPFPSYAEALAFFRALRSSRRIHAIDGGRMVTGADLEARQPGGKYWECVPGVA